MSNLTDMIDGIRIEIDDKNNSKFVFNEDMSGQVASGNKNFWTGNRQIVPLSEIVRADGVVKTRVTDYTIDNTKGQIVFGTAPTISVFVDYYWQDFTDSDVESFVYNGLQHTGYSTGIANVNADLGNTPESLKKAVEHYALYHAFSSLATKTARLFQMGAGKKSINKDNITAKYQKLAEFHAKQGDTTRDDYYKRQGRREAPANGDVNINYPTYTPIR